MVLAKQTYKLSKQGMLDKEIQETIDRNEEELEQVKQDAADAVQKADDLTQQVTDANAQIGQVDIKLETEVGKINTDIHDLNNRLKAPNMIPNPEPMFQLKDYPYSQTSIDIGGWQKMDNRIKNKEIIQKSIQTFNVVKGKKYTIQVEIKTDGTLNSLSFSFYTQTNSSHNETQATLIELGEGHYIAHASWVANVDSPMRVFNIKTLDFTGEYIQFRHPKLEIGEYTPYYLDGKFTTETVKRLQETQDGFVSEISGMKIYQKPNLIGRKEPMVKLNAYPSNVKSTDEEGWAKFDSTVSGQEILPVSYIGLNVQANQKYTQQITIQTDGQLTGLQFTFYTGSHNTKPATILKQNDNTWVAYADWTPTANGELRCIDIKSITIEGGSYVKFCHPKIETGDYTAYNLSDSMNNMVTQISKIEHTQAGIQETVADSAGKIAQNTHTIEGFNSKVQTIEGKLTEHTQTIDGFEDTISNLDGRVTTNTQNIEGFNRRVETIDGKLTEHTQTIDGLKTRVEENTTALEGDPNLIGSFKITPTMTNTGNHFGTRSMDADGWANFGGSSFSSKTINAKFENKQSLVKKKDNQQLTLSFRVNTNCDLFGENCYLKVKIGEREQQLTLADVIETKEAVDVNKPESQCREYKLKYTFIPENDFEYPIILAKTVRKLNQSYNAYSHIAFRDFQIVEGNEPKPYIISNLGLKFSELKQTVDGFDSIVSNQQNQITEITQSASGMQATLQQNKEKINQLTASAQHLQTDIRDLTNNTNSKFSQLSSNINMKVSKGEVVSQINLSPDNVWIDGKKVKITGETYIQNGVIKDAMIASLKVDKLTGNKATFLQSSIDSLTRKVEITSNGMKFTGEERGNTWNNEYLEVDSGHLKIYSDGDYRKQYFYMGTAKRSSALNVTLGVVNNGNDYNDYPTLALRSAKQNNFIATRKSAIMSGTSVYIGNNTAYYDNNNLYNSFLNASTDGNIEMDTTSKVFIGANNGVYFRPGFNKNDSVYFCKDYQWNQEQGIEFTRTDNRGMMIRAKGVYNNTGGDSPNLFIRSSGYIYRSTSARKYKEDIEYMHNLEQAKQLLHIDPASWIDKAEKEAFREGKERTLPRRVGFIADDFYRLGLTDVVVKDEKGEIEGLAYDKISIYIIPLLKDLYYKLGILEKEINELKGKNKQ